MEFVEAIDRIHEWDPLECRQRVLDGFTHTVMAGNYVTLYQGAVAGLLDR